MMIGNCGKLHTDQLDSFFQNSEQKIRNICLTGVSPLHSDKNKKEDIPNTFDSRSQWPDCPSIPLIRDQSNCGACWAFGAVEAMSDRICIASGGKVKVNISAEDLVACSGVGACDGGWPATAWQYWVDNGLVTGGLYGGEGCMPYAIKPGHHEEPFLPSPACSATCQSGYPKTYTQDKHFGASAYGVGSDVKAIQSEIMKNGPVEADFTVYADFPSYKSGAYIQHSQDVIAGHAIRLIGWGVEGGVPYWLAANSWNTTWGDHDSHGSRVKSEKSNFNHFICKVELSIPQITSNLWSIPTPVIIVMEIGNPWPIRHSSIK